jgi:hypothetical protein
MGSLRTCNAITCPYHKGTRSRDGVQLCCHEWKKLGLNKGRGRFVNFFRCSSFRNFFFIFLAVNANPTALDYAIGVYLVKILLLFTGQDNRPVLPNG